jgi:hypothetical protein
MDRKKFAQTQGSYRFLLAGGLALTVNVAFGYALGHGPTAGQRSYNVGTEASSALTADSGARAACKKS